MIGSVYRIIHLESEICYVGSTFNELRHRWQQHRGVFKKRRENGLCGASIYPHFKKHGLDQFKMVLIKTYEVVDRAHLEAYETLWIRKLKACNRLQPFAIKKLTDKHSYNKNKDERCAKVRQYHHANRDEILVKQKLYREANKDAISAYREANQSKGHVKYDCACGGKYTHQKKSTHMKTKNIKLGFSYNLLSWGSG